MNKHFFQSGFLCHFQQGFQVVDVAMDAPVTEKTHQVQGASFFFSMLYGVQQDLILKKTAFFNGVGNQGQVLIDDPA